MSWHSSGFTDVDKLLFSVMALNRYIRFVQGFLPSLDLNGFSSKSMEQLFFYLELRYGGQK